MTTTIGSLDLNTFNNLYSDSNQYFWFESDSSATHGAGAHVTLVPDTTFISNPTGQNILMNTDGFSVRNGLLPMMTLGNDSLDFNVVDATTETYVTTATFSSTGSQIGKNGESHLELDYRSMKLVDTQGNDYLYISDLLDRDGCLVENYTTDDGTDVFIFGWKCDVSSIDAVHEVLIDGTPTTAYSVAFTTSGGELTLDTPLSDGSTLTIRYIPFHKELYKAYTLGYREPDSLIGTYSHAEGYYVTGHGIFSHVEGNQSSAVGAIAHAEGSGTNANGGSSHAEGSSTTASGYASHTEGLGTYAEGEGSHAEGKQTQTGNVDAAHAEGCKTKATGIYSHAEGNTTTASGSNSHAQNLETIAQRKSQTALGEYNIADTGGTDGTTRGDYAVIVGNGTSDTARSNALTVDWSGNVEASGDVTDGGGNVLSAKANTSSLSAVATSGDYDDLTNLPTIPTKTSDLTNDSNFVGFESGTATAGSVTWEYRKWADGTLEMWGRAITKLNINTAVGNIYTTANEYNIAVPSFVDSVDFVTGELSGGGWVDVTGYGVPPKMRFYAPTAYTSTDRYLRYYLKGTWS